MALSDITHKIQADAQKKQAEIERRTQESLKKLDEQARVERTRVEQDFDLETKRLLERNEQKVTTGAQLESKKHVDTTRRTLVDTVFNDALKNLCNLPDNDYSSLLKKLLQEVPQNITGTIKTPASRVQVVEKLIAQFHPNLSTEIDDSITGGFIVETDVHEYDFTFNSLVASKKNELEIEVSNILFS